MSREQPHLQPFDQPSGVGCETGHRGGGTASLGGVVT